MIGVFDSGVGGLSVLGEIRFLMPDVDLVYVADRGRAPYGTKDLHEVRAISFELTEWLMSEGASTIVLACNTASAAALHELRDTFRDVSFVGMEPAVKPAALTTTSRVVAVLATSVTFQGRLFDSVVSRHAADVEVIEAVCPSWVDLVESGQVEGPTVEAHVRAVVQPILNEGADTLVLGCTHFAFLSPVIADFAGTDIEIIDPGPAVAAQVARMAAADRGAGRIRMVTSGDPGELDRLIARLTKLDTASPALPFPT